MDLVQSWPILWSEVSKRPVRGIEYRQQRPRSALPHSSIADRRAAVSPVHPRDALAGRQERDVLVGTGFDDLRDGVPHYPFSSILRRDHRLPHDLKLGLAASDRPVERLAADYHLELIVLVDAIRVERVQELESLEVGPQAVLDDPVPKDPFEFLPRNLSELQFSHTPSFPHTLLNLLVIN